MKSTSPTRTKFLLLTLASVLLMPCLSGCGTSNLGDADLDADLNAALAAKGDQSNASSTQIVAASAAEGASSPTQTNQASIDDTDPLIVCQDFMQLLQSGNRIGAENHLTKTAMSVTGRAGMALEPIGMLNAPFQLSNLRFATIKNDIAYIDSQVGQAEEQTMLTWMLKKQNTSWKIAGLMMKIDDGNSPRLPGLPRFSRFPRLVSFENPDDVELMKSDDSEQPVATADKTE